MSIWSTWWYAPAWQVDEVPDQKVGEVSLASSFGGFVRLSVDEDVTASVVNVVCAGVMLSPEEARELGSVLIQWADEH